ncbi:MAG TPA: 50S ribosomal protein L22 [Planctomycetota bacterium]|nr:50S ribosomal protein L22 [Planctomycetota bacterium]
MGQSKKKADKAASIDEASKIFVAKHRYARMTARKGRYIMDLVRGMPVNEALNVLEHNPRRAAAFIRKVLASAVANASHDEDTNVNRLRIQKAFVDDGPLLQNRLRWRPGPQGRAMPIRKRTCHITVMVGED